MAFRNTSKPGPRPSKPKKSQIEKSAPVSPDLGSVHTDAHKLERDTLNSNIISLNLQNEKLREDLIQSLNVEKELAATTKALKEVEARCRVQEHLNNKQENVISSLHGKIAAMQEEEAKLKAAIEAINEELFKQEMKVEDVKRETRSWEEKWHAKQKDFFEMAVEKSELNRQYKQVIKWMFGHQLIRRTRSKRALSTIYEFITKLFMLVAAVNKKSCGASDMSTGDFKDLKAQRLAMLSHGPESKDPLTVLGMLADDMEVHMPNVLTHIANSSKNLDSMFKHNIIVQQNSFDVDTDFQAVNKELKFIKSQLKSEKAQTKTLVDLCEKEREKSLGLQKTNTALRKTEKQQAAKISTMMETECRLRDVISHLTGLKSGKNKSPSPTSSGADYSGYSFHNVGGAGSSKKPAISPQKWIGAGSSGGSGDSEEGSARGRKKKSSNGHSSDEEVLSSFFVARSPSPTARDHTSDAEVESPHLSPSRKRNKKKRGSKKKTQNGKKESKKKGSKKKKEGWGGWKASGASERKVASPSLGRALSEVKSPLRVDRSDLKKLQREINQELFALGFETQVASPERLKHTDPAKHFAKEMAQIQRNSRKPETYTDLGQARESYTSDPRYGLTKSRPGSASNTRPLVAYSTSTDKKNLPVDKKMPESLFSSPKV